MSGNSVMKLPPYYYLHVLDRNTQVTRLEVGPKTLRIAENEDVSLGPEKMLVLPPQHYCIVANPVVRSTDPRGDVVLDESGQARLRYGDLEVRAFTDEPFPLWPGETLKEKPTLFTVVPPNCALRLHAHRDFTEDVFEEAKEKEKEKEKGKAKEGATATAKAPAMAKVGTIARRAGDEWLFHGPATYIPRVEVEVMEQREARIVLPDTALRMRAVRECTDYKGKRRVAGEEWLVRVEGAYMQSVDERVIGECKAHVLTPKVALHLRAKVTFTDRFGTEHRKGEEWLVTHEQCETYIEDVEEEVVGNRDIVTLAKGQFCVVLNPYGDEGKAPQLGTKRQFIGPATFFLRPGEELDGSGVRNTYVLGCDEAVRVRCISDFVDGGNVRRVAGSQWLVCGPREYIPPLEVNVLESHKAFVAIEGLNFYIWEKSNAVASISLAVFVVFLAIIMNVILKRM